MENSTLTTKNEFTAPNSFIFKVGDSPDPIIVIDKKGFWYKDNLIEDAGEVYQLFKDFFQTANK